MFKSLKDKFMGPAPTKGSKKGGASEAREIENGREYKLVCIAAFPDVIVLWALTAVLNWFVWVIGCDGRRWCW